MVNQIKYITKEIKSSSARTSNLIATRVTSSESPHSRRPITTKRLIAKNRHTQGVGLSP